MADSQRVPSRVTLHRVEASIDVVQPDIDEVVLSAAAASQLCRLFTDDPTLPAAAVGLFDGQSPIIGTSAQVIHPRPGVLLLGRLWSKDFPPEVP